MKSNTRPLPVLAAALGGVILTSLASIGYCQTDCTNLPPQSTLVIGCEEQPAAGEIGYGTVLADMNQDPNVEIDVPVVDTPTAISTFSFDLKFPSDLLDYDTTIPGNLTSNFFLFGGELQPSGDVVRVVGVISSSNAIPVGSSGNLATIKFTVKQEGCDEFAMVALDGHLTDYSICQGATSTMSASFDVKPNNCKNRIRVGLGVGLGGGLMDMAVLGTDDILASDVNYSSITLSGPGGQITPVSSYTSDVNEPGSQECDCGNGPDTKMDYVLKFNKAAVVGILGEVENGDEVMLTLRGEAGGVPFTGNDCVTVRKTGRSSVVADPPFAPRVIVDLDEAESVRLKVFDIAGRLVSTLYDGTKPAGSHTFTFDSATRSGVYFVRFEGESIETHKVVVIR